MRLIHAETLKLELFNDESKLPKFAILSHRWVEAEEVLFKDIIGFDPELAELITHLLPAGRVNIPTRLRHHLKGWDKIQRCCEQALKDDIKYVWVDTCCINKDSSAELSEAINSMFRWYAKAEICYAYLVDVNIKGAWEKEFVRSSWFKRAWTLQELLAPKSVVFYDKNWRELGKRSELSEDIAAASGIHLAVFTAEEINLDHWSIAQRMSWASRREALRPEDLAYSLLGIFDVNMPLVYGEGMEAFQRLQKTIIQQSDDHTIFAWSGSAASDGFTGVFAPSPAAFVNDGSLVQHPFDHATTFSLTNLGLKMDLPLQSWAPEINWAGLNCTRNSLDQVGIFLVRDNSPSSVLVKSHVDGVLNNEMRKSDLRCQRANVTIATRLTSNQLRGLSRDRTSDIPGIMVERIKVYGSQMKPIQDLVSDTASRSIVTSPDPQMQCYPTVRGALVNSARKSSRFDVDVKVQASTPCYGSICVVEFSHFRTAVRALMLGIDHELRPFCMLAEPNHKAYRAWGTPSKQKDESIDHGHSLHFKDFHECTGLEEDGWIRPCSELQQHPTEMRSGLWGLKGNASHESWFLLQLSNVVVDIRFKELRFEDGRRYWHLVMRRSDRITGLDTKENLHLLNIALGRERESLMPATSQDSIASRRNRTHLWTSTQFGNPEGTNGVEFEEVEAQTP